MSEALINKMEIILCVVSSLILILGIYIGKSVRFYQLYYELFKYEMNTRTVLPGFITPHPEMFDDNGNYIEDDLFAADFEPDDEDYDDDEEQYEPT